MKHVTSARAAGLAALCLFATCASAETIRATSGFGPSHVIATDAYTELATRVDEFTQGRWTLQDTPSGLVSLSEMSNGLRDGVTEFGALLLPYFAADYPESALPSELANLGSRSSVISAAVTEYLVTCTECQAEFTRNGQVFLGNDATPPYDLLSTRPVATAADIKGLRVRIGAPYFAALIESFGGIPVHLPASELFEGLSQGVIDAAYSGSYDIVGQRLGDVTQYVTELHAGTFNGAAITTASGLLWARMDPTDRAALTRASQYAILAGLAGLDADARAARDLEGMTFITPSEDIHAGIEAFNAEYLAGAADRLTKRGVKDAAAKVVRYNALVDKWENLINDQMSADEVVELRWNEIWSGVDFSSYGE